MAEKKTETIKLSELKGNPQNPRRMREENAKGLKSSMERFGDLSGITYNVRSGQLVTGHQRKNVLLKLIGEDPEVTWVERHEPTVQYTVGHGYFTLGTEKYRVRFVDMDEKTEAAANLAANNAFIMGEYDLELLPTVLDLADHTGLTGELRLDSLAGMFVMDAEREERAQSQTEEKEYDPTNLKLIKLQFGDEEYVEVVDKMDALLEERGYADYAELVLDLVRNA